jgi:hypothetical protein
MIDEMIVVLYLQFLYKKVEIMQLRTIFIYQLSSIIWKELLLSR